MSSDRLIERFRSLPIPDTAETGPELFSSERLTNDLIRHVAKDHRGRATILLADADPTDVFSPPVQLQELEIRHGVQCRLHSARVGDNQTRRFTVFRCLSDDASLSEFFLLTMDGALRAIAGAPNRRQIDDLVEGLVRLFTAIGRLASGSAIGLWGELFVMFKSGDTKALLETWHAEPEDRYDFVDGCGRLEVKGSGFRRREHHFSFEQTYPPDGVTAIVASLFCERVPHGVTLGWLWDEVKSRAGAEVELVLKVDRLCIAALGATWRQARQIGFDDAVAMESLRFYDVRSMPRVTSPQPAGVSQIHFVASLDAVEPLTPEDATWRDGGKLLEVVHALCRRH